MLKNNRNITSQISNGGLNLLIVLLSVITLPTMIFLATHKQTLVQNASAPATQHYEYMALEGSVSVYDLDNNFNKVKTINLPQTAGHGVRGIVASPATHTLYVSFGGDAGSQGNGSLLAYDLFGNQVVWVKNYTHGIDSMSITPDGKTIYMPDGELSNDGKWYIVDAATGNENGVIDTGVGTNDNGPHNTVMSINGSHVYMGDRNYAHSGSNYFYVADTKTNQIIQKVGPFQSGIRPFTINSNETLVYSSVTGFLGFQVGNLTTGKILYTVPIIKPSGVLCGNSGASDPSHGVSLSPDEKELYVIDYSCNYVHVFDVSGVPNAMPKEITAIPVHPFTKNQTPCSYDCLGDGWVRHTYDGHHVLVGDSGDVIDTTTRTVVANIPDLINTRIYTEIDWQNGLPIATTSRSGLGYGIKTISVPSPSFGPVTNPVSSAGLLPGQQLWNKNISSYIFGTDDTGEWGAPNIEFTDKSTAPGTINTISQNLVRQAGFTLDRVFIPHNDFATHSEMTDAEIQARLNTALRTNTQCFGVLVSISTTTPQTGQTMSDFDFAKHVLSLSDGTHSGYAKCSMFEIGNEFAAGPSSMTTYVQQWNTLVPLLKAIRPDAIFIGPALPFYNSQVMRQFLQGARPVPDAVSWHQYACGGSHSHLNDAEACSQVVAGYVLSETTSVKQDMLATIGHLLPLGISEWSADNRPNGNLNLAMQEPGMSHFITNALNAMMQAHLDFANEFDIQSGAAYRGLDMLDSNNAPRPYYFAFLQAIAGAKSGQILVNPSPTNTIHITATPTSRVPLTPTPTSHATSTPVPNTAGSEGSNSGNNQNGTTLVLYDNKVTGGFNDYTFGYASRNACDTSEFTSSPCSYSITYNGYGGIDFFYQNGTINTGLYKTLQYNLDTNNQPISDFAVYIQYANNGSLLFPLSNSNITQTLSINGKTWIHISIPVSQLNPQNASVTGVQLKNKTSNPLAPIHVDEVLLSQ